MWISALTELSAKTPVLLRLILDIILILMASVIAVILFMRIREIYVTRRKVEPVDVMWWLLGAVVSVAAICEGFLYLLAIVLE